LPEIRVFEDGWRDRRWTKGIRKLSKDQVRKIEASLQELIVALGSCTHPILDPELQRWSPTLWHAPGKKRRRGTWCEYRFGDRHNRARAIVCHDSEEQVIYLVARTVTHDHRRLAEVVKSF
jgi:hypothetical protein